MFIRSWTILVAFIGLATPAVPQQTPQTQPAEPLTTADQARLDDLLNLIQGPNSLQARATGVRELLRQNWPGTSSRLAAILGGADEHASIAVATALADLPQHLHPQYVDPLVAMVVSQNPAVRTAAGNALAAYRDGGVVAKLRTLVLDRDRSDSDRLAAINALGRMMQREAMGALVEAIAEPPPAVSTAALEALEQALAMDFADNPAAARAWWAESKDLSVVQWQQRQIERLVRSERETVRRVEVLETRLVKTLRDAYLRAAENDRATLLLTMLADPLAAVRLLGLDLAQSLLSEGKQLPPEIAAEARNLLSDTQAGVREAAARVVASLRDTSDEPRFIALLDGEPDADVRAALINALGYLGTDAAAEVLLKLFAAQDPTTAAAAAGAVGRLAERGVLDDQTRENVAAALLDAFEKSRSDQPTVRERIIWAMSQVADPRFAPIFVRALQVDEAASVRQAATRGIAALGDPELASSLLPMARDADLGVRQTAVAALAQLAVTDEHLQALWERLTPPDEPDANIRQLAWRGVARVLRERKPEEIIVWIERLPPDGAELAQRKIELLQLADTALGTAPESRAKRGRIRALKAVEFIKLDQIDDALTAYMDALEVLGGTEDARCAEIALSLLELAFQRVRYDQDVAGAVAGCVTPPDAQRVWSLLRGVLDARIQAGQRKDAANLLAAVREHPPTPFSDELSRKMDAYAAERLAPPATQPSPPAPATHPTPAPTSAPSTQPA